MSSFRANALALLIFSAPASLALIASDAHASVSIAIAFEPLVKESSAVAIFSPTEQTSLWENGRIYTYTRLHADNAIAGDVMGPAANSEVWVRTMGGVVGHIGQLVDGEPVLTVGRPSLLFLRPGPAGAYEVTARAQGQFPVTLDATTKQPKLMKSSAVGLLLQAKPGLQAQTSIANPPTPGATDKKTAPGQTQVLPQALPAAVAPLLAGEALHGKPVDDAVKDITAAWKRLHAK